MLVILPVLTLFSLIAVLIGHDDQDTIKPTPWQGAFLVGISVWGAYLVFLTETLSLVHGISRWPFAIGWSLALIAVLAQGGRTNTLRRGLRFVLSGFRSLDRVEIGVLTILGVLAVILFAVAVAAPTNNVDAMDYHMPRVMEWAQNHTLTHFPTPHEYQNLRPYWAEAAILHFRVLWGNDQPAGLVQWMIMLSSVIAASGITGLLGGNRKAQLLTAVIAFSIPMGLLQSTTTQNDYVSAFWVVCLAYFVILSRQRQLMKLESLGIGLSLGLGMLTKGTFFPYAAPLMAWFFVGRLVDRQWKKVFLEGIVIALVVLATNGLFWARNIQSTGGPYGAWNPLELLGGLLPSRSLVPDTNPSVGISGAEAESQAWELSTAETDVETSGLSFNFQSVPSRDQGVNPRLAQVVRLVAMNFVSPFAAFNQVYFRGLLSRPELFSEHYVRKLENAAWNHEDTAGSPVHMVFVLISMFIAGYQSVRKRFRYGIAISLVLVSSYLLVSLIGWGEDIYVIRYQLGYFLLGAPLVALVMSRWERVSLLLTGLLILYSLPYVFLSNMRPVIGHKPWPTRVDSVFVASKDDLLFAINPGDEQGLVEISERIKTAGCEAVGLSYLRNNLEYQIWYLLGAPQSGIFIRHLDTVPAFDSRRDLSFEPCAVICTGCEALPDYANLTFALEFGRLRLFLQGDDG